MPDTHRLTTVNAKCLAGREALVEELEHPGWCDQKHCTATVPRPEYRAGETGYHRSVPITVEDVPNVGDVVFDPELNPLVAHLSRPAPPWDPVTFLNLGTVADPEHLSLPTAHARAALRQLEALLALAAADEQAGGADS
jgi:hypothetical protein